MRTIIPLPLWLESAMRLPRDRRALRTAWADRINACAPQYGQDEQRQN
jgi:hypothetical protein